MWWSILFTLAVIAVAMAFAMWIYAQAKRNGNKGVIWPEWYVWLTTTTQKRPGTVVGIFWGGFMWISMVLLPVLAEGKLHGAVLAGQLIFGAVIWGIGGLAFGWAMYRFFLKRHLISKKEQSDVSRLD